MNAYAKISKSILDEFVSHSLTRIPQSKNSATDPLAALALSSEPGQDRVIPVECIKAPSIQVSEDPTRPSDSVLAVTATHAKDDSGSDVGMSEPEDSLVIEEWQTEIKAYIEHGTLPKDRWAARRLKTRCARYSIIDGQLFR